MDNCIIGKRTTSSYFYISFKSVPSSVSSAMCTSLTSIVSAYINDMTETSTSSQTKLFVDDRLLSNNNQVDHNLLQKDLTSLEDWQMIFNAKQQFIVIRITQRNKEAIETSYKLHVLTLDNVDSSKYLGVTISNKLSGEN